MIVILLSLLGLVMYRYVIMKKEIRYLTKQIKCHQKNYTNIRTHLLDKDVQELVVHINHLYDEKQAVNAAQKNTQEQMSQNIANISHDLRTPLTSMIGYLQLLEDEKLSKEERKNYQEIIKSRTIALKNLIQDFYDLSLIQSKGYVFNYVAVDLNQVLCETLATYFHEFEIKKIEPHINLELSKAPLISDYQALTRIFSNLIHNVLKHGSGQVEITLSQQGNNYVTTFTNDAPLLNEEDLKHLFERFYTGDKSRSNKNTGLGLAITKSLVEGLGNELEVALVDGKLVTTIYWVNKKV